MEGALHSSSAVLVQICVKPRHWPAVLLCESCGCCRGQCPTAAPCVWLTPPPADRKLSHIAFSHGRTACSSCGGSGTNA